MTGPPLVDTDALAAWLDAQGIALGGPLEVTRITTGHSNEMFLVARAGETFVLRRPPRTPLSPTAHDMAREHRLLSSFVAHGADVPVPRPVALCTDLDVIGVPFYLMEPLDGTVVRETMPEPFASDADAPAGFADALVDLLAGIHGFDWRAGGLEDFGRPEGYLDRQVPRWLGQLEKYKTRDIPEVDEAGRWLAAHTPTMQAPTVIHGDYKLDNVMFRSELPVTPLAVLDWEQATVGDPLVDLGWLLGMWLDPSETASGFGGANLALHGPRRAADAGRARGSLRRDDRSGSVGARVLLRARAVQARVRDGGFVRALQGRHERRPVLRVPRGRRARAGAPRARVRGRLARVR